METYKNFQEKSEQIPVQSNTKDIEKIRNLKNQMFKQKNYLRSIFIFFFFIVFITLKMNVYFQTKFYGSLDVGYRKIIKL